MVPRKSVLKAAVQGAVGIEPRNSGAYRQAIDRVKISPEEHFAIVLGFDRIDGPVGPPQKSVLKVTVESTVRIQPRNSVSAYAIDATEKTPNEHFVIDLRRDRPDVAVSTGRPILKASVQSAVRIEPRNPVTLYAIDCVEHIFDRLDEVILNLFR